MNQAHDSPASVSPSRVERRAGAAHESEPGLNAARSRVRRLPIPAAAAFAATLFLNAALLFLVEPMLAKMVLPLLGGSAAVWTTCMVFFQVSLLAGYAYAHATAILLGKRAQVVLHMALLLGAMALLPVHLPGGWTPPVEANPVGWLLRLLVVAVGLPFFALTATTPILQVWYARSGYPSSGDPYFLYAASNAGSILGLLSYPFVFEPLLRLTQQARLWAWCYGLFLLFVGGCAVFLWHAPFRLSLPESPPPGTREEEVRAPAGRPVTLRRRLRWMALAFVPSSLMLGVTTALTTDIPPIPLFWVLPLALYLLSFVLVFARRPVLSHVWLSRRLPLLILVAAIPIALKGTLPLLVLLAIDLLTLLAAAMVCHGEVARDRPSAGRLTEFYLWIAVGGVLGGAFNALVAPMIFRTVLEFPIALVLAAILCPSFGGADDTSRARRLDYLLPAALGLAVAIAILELQFRGMPPGRMFNLIIFGPAAILLLRFASRPRRFGMGVAALILSSQVYAGPFGHTLYSARSFYGVYHVSNNLENRWRVLFHGSTVHGMQSLDAARECDPLAYFTRRGPIGQVFHAFQGTPLRDHVAVIGLGGGVMACYHQPGQRFTFYELDPTVLRLAQDPGDFTYLSRCASGVRVVLGDARRSMRDAPARSFGIIVLDAFSGDSIPTHLLTREALALYLAKLAPNGIMAFHITNRFLDLHGVLGSLARDAGLICWKNDDDRVTETEAREGKFTSWWVVMARRADDLAALAGHPGWEDLPAPPGERVWTDDYSNIVSLFMVR